MILAVCTGFVAGACDSTDAGSDTSEADTVTGDTAGTVDTTAAAEDTRTDDDTAETATDTSADGEAGDSTPDVALPDAADAVEDGEDGDDTAVADTTAADTAVPLFDPLPVVPPAGFEVYTAGNGVTVYKKDYAGGQPDWVAVIDLRIAELHSVVGDAFPPPTASVEQRATIQHWDDAVAEAAANGQRARVLVSGAYFSPSPDPAPLAHGLRMDGGAISYGYGLGEYPGFVSLVGWDNENDEATIVPYDILVFEQYPDVVGALMPTVPTPDHDAYKARPLVGVRDFDGDGKAEAFFILASKLQNYVDGPALLADFGATAVGGWTGGGTTSFVVDGVELVSPLRRVPHTVAVYEPLDYGCAAPCPAHSACDPASHLCVCDPGFSGPSCATCEVCTPSQVIVDDGDPGFTTFGEKYWWTAEDHDAFVTRAHASDVRYTFGDPAGVLVYLGRWLTPTPLTGTYKLEVHVAAPDPFDPAPDETWVDSWTVCDEVRYVVRHDGAPAGELVTIGHHVAGWVTLKDAVTLTARPGEVRVDDRASPSLCAVQFDAIRWTRVGP